MQEIGTGCSFIGNVGGFPFPCSIENFKIERKALWGCKISSSSPHGCQWGWKLSRPGLRPPLGGKNCRSKVKRLKLKYRGLAFITMFLFHTLREEFNSTNLENILNFPIRKQWHAVGARSAPGFHSPHGRAVVGSRWVEYEETSSAPTHTRTWEQVIYPFFCLFFSHIRKCAKHVTAAEKS